MEGIATEYFQHIAAWQVVICKECRYAIWPNHIQGHLTGKQHRVPKKEAQAIAEEVQEWPGVVQNPSELEIPNYVDAPIAEIPLHQDGFKCKVEPRVCSYIGRSQESIRKHWREQHQWSVRNRRGGSGVDKKASIQRRFDKGARQVHCQRLFAQGMHSQFFEIRQPEAVVPEQVHASTSEAALQQAWERAQIYWDEIQQQANSKIQPGAADEVSPWLQRTGWIEYLEGCDQKDLLQSIREPQTEDIKEDDNSNNDEERNEAVAAAIWKAMGEVAAMSQTTVEHSGVMLRLEAVRTEMHQTRYQPLQPYQDATSIKERCRPWQQMLVFFVRTQRSHSWQSPQYQFNRQQARAFDRLTAAAECQIDQSDSEEESVADNDSIAGSVIEDGSTAGSVTEDDSTTENYTGRNRTSDSTAPNHSPPKFGEIHKACLAFCIELLNQQIHNREYDMALICATAVLGVHPFRTGFRDPETYPPVLSAMIKVAHYMVVQYAEQLGRPAEEDQGFSPCGSPCEFDDSGYESNGSSNSDSQHPRHRSRRHQRSSFEWVHEMMDKFMVRGTASPVQWMLDLRTYGLKIHYNTTAIGHVNWKDQSTLEYKALQFSMDDFRGMIHQLHAATRKALLEDVLFANEPGEMPSIPWNVMHDDPSNGEVGWNFIQDQRSKFPTTGQDWLFQRIQRETRLRERFASSQADTGIDQARMRDYMRQVSRFRGMLLILMHMTGGQPARGTEILSVRHRNTIQGGHRNLFIEDGMVVFVTKYHKGYQMSGDVKIIHRYLPREVGELVVWYLWLALPFVQRMEAMVWQKPAPSDHMWPMDVDGRKWTTDRMKDELRQVSQAALGQSIHVAAYREIAIAISRQWVRGATAFQVDEDEENNEWRKDHILSEAADVQASHSPHIAGMIYARSSMEMSGATFDRRQQFRAVSGDWHRFIGFASSQIPEESHEGERGAKRKRCAFDDHARDEQMERRIRLRQMDAMRELQWMMRKEVTFRSAQGEAMEAIQKGESPIIAVMPTGAGKSVLFMLPAFVEAGGVTIVVVPLRALRRDMVHRCEELGIRHAVWDGIQQPDGASIILVTPEKATQGDFMTFLKRIRQTKRLDRIIIDECHVVLNDQLDFRKHLQQLGQLGGAETQMVLLTATLPPREEGRLLERMYWRREEVRMIRASTVRVNIQYSVVDGGGTLQQRDERLEQIVAEVLSDARQPEGKVVIMCESKPGVRRIAKKGLFPCEEFHADLSEEQKDETLNEFRNGNVRVIVATGAFGMGIDIPNIRLIVHMDQPRNMMDYGQASGRAGRDGLASRAVIIRGGLTFPDELVERYMQPDRVQCRRFDMDSYLDGNHDRERCQEGELACDICEQAMAISASIDDGLVSNTQAPAWQGTQAPGRSQGTQAPGSTQGTQAPGASQSTQASGSLPNAQAPVSITQTTPRFASQDPQAPRTLPTTQAPRTLPTTQAPAATLPSQPRSVLQDAQAPGSDRSRAAEERSEPQRIQREIAVQDQQRAVPHARQLQQVRQQTVGEAAIRQRLERWKGVCVICHQAGRSSQHSISRCPTPEGRSANGECEVMRKSIRLPAGVACFKCQVPQSICDRWSDGFQRTNAPCQFYGILCGVVWGVKEAYPKMWSQWIVRHAGPERRMAESKEVFKFLGEEARGADVRSVQLLQAFMWFTSQI